MPGQSWVLLPDLIQADVCKACVTLFPPLFASRSGKSRLYIDNCIYSYFFFFCSSFFQYVKSGLRRFRLTACGVYGGGSIYLLNSTSPLSLKGALFFWHSAERLEHTSYCVHRNKSLVFREGIIVEGIVWREQGEFCIIYLGVRKALQACPH